MSEASEDAFSLIEDGPTPSGLRMRDSDIGVAGGYVSHAIDALGCRHLLIPLTADQRPIADHRGHGVSLRPRNLEDDRGLTRYIDVTCEETRLRDLFAIFCDDLLDRLESDSAAPAAVCASVLDRWRDLFSSAGSRLLGEQALVGLLAELHVLERIAQCDPQSAIRLWTGPDKARADFTGGLASLEVKSTTNRERATIVIHGIWQLDQASLEEVYLHVEQFERVPSGGDSVPGAVARLLATGVGRAELLRSLTTVGYLEADRGAYELFRFESTAAHTFRASEPGFPRLVPSSLVDPTLALKIHEVRYSIDVSDSESIGGHLPGIESALAHLLRSGE
ncbi:MAG: hypothetical protein JWO62_2324 [Acidimicrobiaceae bacterium]|nr:hypothetical protein [Acidimicrobiaceae bacterium]